MTKTLSVKNCLQDASLIGQTITINGWVRSRRDSKAGMSFIAVNDGSCFDSLQAVAPSTLENYPEILKLTKDCAVSITGKIIESPAQGQSVELETHQVEIIGWIDDPETYPMSAKRHTMEHLREHAHLRVRTNIIGAVTRVRHTIAQAIHSYFNDHGFFWVNTPLITASDCEGAGELFRVSTLDLQNLPRTEQDVKQIDFKQDFFGTESFLTVSGQLNAEAYALAMSKVYTFGPTFRAENSNTSRHLAEFWMVEPEVAFADLNTVAKLAEDLLKHVVNTVLKDCAADLNFFNQWVDKTCIERLNQLANSQFVQMDYTDAVEQLLNAKQKFEYPVKWGIDLQSEHERYLCEHIVKGPVILKNYPKDIKAFYMRMNDDNKTVAAMDLLVPGVGELMGGSQREERLDKLDARLAEMNIDAKHLNWYRDLRRYGSVPHAGFGMGFERLIRYITGVENIRDVIPFPRVPGNAKF